MTALRKRMIEDMQLRNFSPQTQRTYLHHIAGLAQFYQTSPEHLNLEDLRQFQWRRAVDLGVVHVEARGNTARGEGLAQAIEKRIQPPIGIELGVRDEAAGVVERGL